MVCEWRPEVVVLEEDIQIWHRVTHTCRLKCFTRLSRPHLQYWLSEQILIQLQPPSKKIALIIFLLSETRTPTQEIHRKNYPSCSASTRLTEFRIGSRIAQMSTLVTVTGGSRLTLRVCFTHNYGFRAMTFHNFINSFILRDYIHTYTYMYIYIYMFWLTAVFTQTIYILECSMTFLEKLAWLTWLDWKNFALNSVSGCLCSSSFPVSVYRAVWTAF